MDVIKKLLHKYREPLIYIINGGFTTIINFAVYIVMTKLFGTHVLIANTIAWITAVIYAFVTNKIFVFRNRQNILKQFVMFSGLRVISYLIEETALYLFVIRWNFDDLIVKILVAVIIVATNYIFSKFIIFKKSAD